ncbi:MAG: hypothetical protein C4532_01875 [Candidatus Abyssobacteria bacterium SURF_17]|jgi:type II secretory pathway component PulF|uniref:Uncharacterized protein n=1 Tax=Candidatus Abyssobacteria bacterium SURF_17 TaxID=2093361 RepID=A0A419F829_9BACT|nr:MAG: hypothetical protein C4532_01875 [Candidatus Abyssubacteria bacterium SURF_17]
MKKFYYIALKEGRTCEGIVRCDSIDSAREELMREGLREINLAILRSDAVDFLDMTEQTEGSAG